MSLIALRDLTKRYPRGVVALDGLTLELEPGIIGLVGANGAGKSTLIKILLGLLPPTSGEATVMDLDVATEGTTIRQFVGYMPEHDCLPPDISATDFVTHMARMSGLPKAAARERTAEVLRHVGLYEERYRAIGGYSTGMKQRVKLAQALVHDPRLLLLDEPTNGLDPAGRDEMLALVRRTGTEFGIAVIVASHLLGEIERTCDFLVAIDAGRLLRAAPLGGVHRTDGRPRGRGRGGRRRAGRVRSSGAACRPSPTAGRSSWRSPRRRQYDIVRDSIADLGLPLVRLEQRRQSLEDLFRDDVPATAAQAASPGSAGHPAAAGGERRERPPASRPQPRAVERTGRQHLRPRLPGLRRAAAGASQRGPRALRADGPVLLRDRPRRSGQDRAVRARRPGDPAGRPRGRVRGARGAGGRGRRRARGRLADHATRATTASSAS